MCFLFITCLQHIPRLSPRDVHCTALFALRVSLRVNNSWCSGTNFFSNFHLIARLSSFLPIFRKFEHQKKKKKINIVLDAEYSNPYSERYMEWICSTMVCKKSSFYLVDSLLIAHLTVQYTNTRPAEFFREFLTCYIVCPAYLCLYKSWFSDQTEKRLFF